MALIKRHESPELDRFGNLATQKEGRLVLRMKGVWDTICVDTISRKIGQQVCNLLGYGYGWDVWQERYESFFSIQECNIFTFSPLATV